MSVETAPVTLVAATLKSIEAKGQPRTPGSVVEYCGGCKVPVSLGPKGQSEIAARPGSRVLCTDCAVVAVKNMKRAKGNIEVRNLRTGSE